MKRGNDFQMDRKVIEAFGGAVNRFGLRRKVVALATSIWLVAFLNGCSNSPNSTPTTNSAPSKKVAEQWFEESSAKAGLNFRHSSGHTTRFYIPEMMTGGVGLLDYDNDGLLDIFCVQGGSLDSPATNFTGHRLYHNLGHAKFEDVTSKAGVGGHGYGMGCACADFDGDGFTDIYVTCLKTNILFRNNGDGTFTDVSIQAGVTSGAWGTSCAFFDYDGDGNLDLVIANYLNWSREREVDCYSRGGQPDYCSPMSYKSPAMDTLFHNLGNGTFENVTIAAGLDQAFGNGLGVVCADFNHDGRPDFFVANDAMPNQLWINQGNGTFKDEALIRGCAVNQLGIAEAGMGVAVVDLFQHGQLDLFVTHLIGEGNRLFANTDGSFTDLIMPRGPGAQSLPYTGFGVGFADFNNDGILDLYVGNGRVKLGSSPISADDPYAEPNVFMRGLGDGKFEEIFPRGGAGQGLVATSRGVAFGDLDNDGGVDLLVVNKDGPLHFLRNVAGRSGHWITFDVRHRKGNVAIGASVSLESSGKTLWRYVNPNQSYCSSNDPRVHFGLGQEKEARQITVTWPSGIKELFGKFAADQIYELREGKGIRQ